MNTSMNGKLVKTITLGDGDVVVSTHTGSFPKLWLSATYHGDHDEFWVVKEPAGGGAEIVRYNVRYIAKIEWLDD